MPDSKDTKGKIKEEVKQLVDTGKAILKVECENKDHSTLGLYQSWYSKSCKLIQQILTDRLEEFTEYYMQKKRNPDKINYLSYAISDYYMGVSVTRGLDKVEVVNPISAYISKFQQQIYILNSVSEVIDSIITNVKGTLQADIFDAELDSAQYLSKNGFIRAAGAMAGVIIEKHFGLVAENHKIKIAKKSPTIADYNDIFKDAIYDVVQWRFIQRLADIRNYCAHDKGREPTKEEVQELLDGTSKIIKTLY